MTDGLSAVGRDEERGGKHEEYFDSLVRYLGNSSEENYSMLRQIAEGVDSVRGGYWGGQTRLAKTLDKKLELLRKGDEITWLRLLMSTGDSIHDKLKELSPFPEDDFTHIKYGYGFLGDCKGPLSDMLHDELRRRQIETFAGGSYVIVLPEEITKKMKDLLKDAKIYDVDTRIKVVK